MSTNKQGIASTELCRKLGLRQKTCWLFQQKIMKAMVSSGKYPLMGKVAVDETVGNRKKALQDDKIIKKSRLYWLIEKKGKGVSRMYARVIDNAGSKQLKPFFQDHISTQATITTDKWRGYIPLKEKYPYLVTPKESKLIMLIFFQGGF